MGHKVNPIGFRLSVKKNWQSRWFAKKDYQKFLHEDLKIRNLIFENLGRRTGVSKVEIERSPAQIEITIFSSKPGILIGKGGSSSQQFKREIDKIVSIPVKINVNEVQNPDLDARLVAENIAVQVEKRISYKRARRQALDRIIKSGALGAKIITSGRLAGAEIARREKVSEGKVPLGTLDADIDYALAEAKTTYGIIGIKVWIYKKKAD